MEYINCGLYYVLVGDVLGKYNCRRVQPNNSFPVFSLIKAVTTGMVHWLADKRYVFLFLFL
ncbi:hypothetical protein Hdeb2414_s0013g00417091 [Helianthus debilis subsp. tardiflorus]